MKIAVNRALAAEKKQYINPTVNSYSLTPASHICLGSGGIHVNSSGVVSGGTSGIDNPNNIL